MILVLLGTQNNSFDRLLQEIDNCIDNNTIKEDVIVQAGHTVYNSSKMQILDFISSEELNDLMSRADFIITHGGVGSILNSIKLGKKVIAIPRLAKYKEHVNDHQIQIVEKFSTENYILGINDVSELQKAILSINSFTPKKFESNTNNIINIIDNFINK